MKKEKSSTIGLDGVFGFDVVLDFVSLLFEHGGGADGGKQTVGDTVVLAGLALDAGSESVGDLLLGLEENVVDDGDEADEQKYAHHRGNGDLFKAGDAVLAEHDGHDEAPGGERLDTFDGEVAELADVAPQKREDVGDNLAQREEEHLQPIGKIHGVGSGVRAEFRATGQEAAPHAGRRPVIHWLQNSIFVLKN